MGRFIYFFVIFSSFLFQNLIGDEKTTDPLQKLVEGNKRYVTSTTICQDEWNVKRAALIKGQNPFAIIVSCSDSRVPPEIIFDQTLGDLFVIRVAGNIIDDIVLGSIEYGVKVLGVKLIMVLGHEGCGAVRAALEGGTFNNHIESVVKTIQPAIKNIPRDNKYALEKAVVANVKNVISQMKTSKPVLAKVVDDGSVKIIGGYYKLDSGEVEILK